MQLQAKEAGNIEQEREGGLSQSVSGEAQNTDVMTPENKDNAMIIANGVLAWKILTDGKGPVWRKWNKEKLDAQQSREIQESEAPRQQEALPAGHDVDPHGTDGMECPFAGMSRLGEQQNVKAEASSIQRPGLLPTPPHTQAQFNDGPFSGNPGTKHMSPPPSASGSVSKCPIRMFDELSPEEVADYFETHKHEIPRSHEICVKRYQSNAQSIRQLDAKYGNLVNMIQGLGMKHQPLLPTKEDEDHFIEMDSKSMRKVEKWAQHVQKTPESVAAEKNPLNQDGQEGAPRSSSKPGPCDVDSREGHFDRPLREIRVGESPSRPWGISVPAAATIARQPQEGEGAPLRDDVPAHGQTGAKLVGRHGTEAQMEEKPQMIFTGPVFIGYPAEQAAALIEKCGWDPYGPQGPKA